MQTNPLVSVIIPCYNHEKYVQETIYSIINQTYKKIELLIIDDGSSDSSYDKIYEMEEQCNRRFSRFEVKTRENKGVIETLNNLITMSSGEYIYLIASDDIAAPQAIEVQLDFLVNHPDYALCVGLNDIIDENGQQCYWDENRNNVYNITEAKYISFTDLLIKTFPNINFFSNDFGSYLSFFYAGNHIPNGQLIRKAIYKETGLYVKEAPLEDFYMNMQIAKYSKMKLINQTLFYYRWHRKNIIKEPKMYTYSDTTFFYEIRNYPFLENQITRLKNEITNLNNEIYCLKIRNNELEKKFLNRVARRIMKELRKLKRFLVS